jgi:SAM-dependent methyltransferase
MIGGYVLTRVVEVLFSVGFFDEISRAGRLQPAAFAEEKGLDASILGSLCDVLYASHVLDKEGDAYVLDDAGHLMVEYGRGWFNAQNGYEDVFHDLEPMLRKERTYGVDVARRADLVAKGSGEMGSLLYFPLAVDAIRRQGYRHVLDLGCGDGSFLREACRQIPGLRGYGIDLSPEAIADAERLSREAGLSSRLQFLAHDITTVERTPDLFRNVDVATTFFVLHEVLYRGMETLISFLQGFRQAFPAVPLMVFEVDRLTKEEMRRRAPGMAIPYLLEHDLTHQKPIARDEWPPIFEKAGFTSVEARNLAFARIVIFTLS